VRLRLRNTALAGCLLLAGAFITISRAELLSPQSPAPTEFEELNKVFRASYAARREVSKATAGPILVVSNSDLLFYDKGALVDTANVIPIQFNLLRVFGHLPFGVYLRIRTCQLDGDDTLTAGDRDALKDYLQKMAAAERVLPTVALTPTQIARQVSILARTRAYIEGVLASGKCDAAGLKAFARDLGPDMLLDADEAGAAQIAGTHNQVMAWRTKYPTANWDDMSVVVRGKQMMRRYHVSSQYFARLLRSVGDDLGYPGEGQRLVYYEHPNADKEIDLFATVQIDGEASADFFGDRLRLSRDILADGGGRFLDTLDFNKPVKYP
jgi:hypothetical protein